MQCSCGTAYSDLDGQWESLSTEPRFSTAYVVYLGVCPECGQPGVKLAKVPSYSRADHWLESHTPQDAESIYPPKPFPNRKPVDLDGVPDHVQTDYRNALLALGNGKLYEYANVLARRSLEFMLKDNGYKGRDLAASIDNLISNPSGIPRAILDNIDAVRMLGNWGAHLTGNEEVGWLESTLQQTEWVVVQWERFLEHFYVNPAKDAIFRNQIDGQSSAAGKPPLKSLPPSNGE